jgi:hypothetical protein
VTTRGLMRLRRGSRRCALICQSKPRHQAAKQSALVLSHSGKRQRRTRKAVVEGIAAEILAAGPWKKCLTLAQRLKTMRQCSLRDLRASFLCVQTL